MENISKFLTLIWIWRKRKFRILRNRKLRRFWVRPVFTLAQREQQGAYSNLVAEMRLSDDGTFENFHRMSPIVFDELLRIIGPLIAKVDVRRPPILPQVRLSVTLRFLASGDSMTSLSYLFRIGLSTISEIISSTTKAIWIGLRDKVLSPPTSNELLKISDGFLKKWQFPNSIGAIDGKHIIIQAPPNSGSEYYNYKGRHSIVLLAIADADYCFVYVDVGAQGRQSDGGILKNSYLGRTLHDNALNNIPPMETISNDRPPLPHCIVADEAFPLSSYIMKPYSLRSGLDKSRRVFNYRLSRARRVVENSFGLLVTKWRIFSKPIICKVDTVVRIVLAAVCLHNFIMKSKSAASYNVPGVLDTETADGILVPGSWRDTIQSSGMSRIGRIGANTYTRQAYIFRDHFKEYFCEEGAVPWQWDRI